MFKFFRYASTQVDYGEQECCRDQPLLHGAEYQEFLADEASFSFGNIVEQAANASSAH